jgi:hypothetical protein
MDVSKIDFAELIQTAVKVITKPRDFFYEMPKTGGFANPLIFAVFMGVIAGVVYAAIGILGLGYMQTGVRSGLFMLIYMPIGAIIGSFIGGAILFVIWKLMGSEENYETAFRCVAYLMALSPVVALLALIPYAGGIINLAIYTYFIVIASTEVHNIPSQKAWLVFGIIFVMFALWGVRAEYNIRNMSLAVQEWQKGAKEMEKAAGDMQKQTEEMAKQFQKQAEDMQRQAGK